MKPTKRTADQDEIRTILTSELGNNAEGLKVNELVKCILDVASETTEKAITEVLDQIASISEGNYILKPKNNGGSPTSTEESASSDSSSDSESGSDSVSDPGSGSSSNSGSGSASKSSSDSDSDSDLESGNGINSNITNRNDESESKKQKEDEDECVDVDVDVDVCDSGESKEDEDIDADKSGRVIGGDCKNRRGNWKSDKQKQDEDEDDDESLSKNKKEDVIRGSGGEERDAMMRAYKPHPSKSAKDNPQKDGGDDQNESDDPEESKRGDDNDSTDSWLKEIDGGDDEMKADKGGNDSDSIFSWLEEIDGGDDEDEPPEENISPSYYDPHFIQAKHNVELVFDNEGYVSPNARKHVGYKEISTTKDTGAGKKRPLEDSTNLNRDSETVNMRRPKKPRLTVVQEGPILGSSRDQQGPPKRDSIQVQPLKFTEESKKAKATKNMPANLEIVNELNVPEVTAEAVTTFEMHVLPNKHRAKKRESSTNVSAKEAGISLGKGKQPGLVGIASKDQSGQTNKGTTSFKGVSMESKTRPGKEKHVCVLSENVPKEKMNQKTTENTDIKGSSKESVMEPVQEKHSHAPSIKSFQEQKKPNRGKDTSKESCKVPKTTKPVQVKHPQPLALNSSEKEKQRATKAKPSSKEGSKKSDSRAPSQLKQSLSSVDKHSQEQKKAASKGAVSLTEGPKESIKTGKDNQHKLCRSQGSAAQPTKEQRKVTKEQGKVTKEDASLTRETSKDSGTKSDKEKHLTSSFQKPKSTDDSKWKISFKSSELQKYKNIAKDDTHGNPLQKPELMLEQSSGSTFMSTDDIEVRKSSVSTSMDIDGIVPKEVNHGKGGTASAKAVDTDHPPGREDQIPNQRHIQRAVGVERDGSTQQKMGRVPIIVDHTHLDQIKNNVHGASISRVIRKRDGSEEIRGAISNEKDMNDREPPCKEGKLQTSDTNEPCDAEEAKKNSNTEREEGEISDTEENDIINEDTYRNQGNRNEEINKQPLEIDLLIATQETEVQNDCYKKYLKEVPQQWEPPNNLNLYKEYVNLYGERHNCYMITRKALERTIEEFKGLKRNLDKAKHEKNRSLFKQLIQSIRKKHAEVENMYCSKKKAYMILHKELDNLKGHILSFYEANSNSMDTSATSPMQH